MKQINEIFPQPERTTWISTADLISSLQHAKTTELAHIILVLYDKLFLRMPGFPSFVIKV
jgi:hypothetical protein